MTWLKDFASIASQTDQFAGTGEHVQLLAAGLAGESGSILAELKKQRREHQVFVSRRAQMCEEIGDFLWYFVRLVDTLAPGELTSFVSPEVLRQNDVRPQITPFLEFGAQTSLILRAVASHGSDSVDTATAIRRTWTALVAISVETGISLQEAALANRTKIQGRWPSRRTYSPLFDRSFPEDEQLPRLLDVEFVESIKDGRSTVVMRCNGLNLGDRLTDNHRDADGYRFHDVFHFSHLVHLGWSPILRGMFRCKRKSIPRVDEAEDGARAGIIEESIAAIVFGRAKQLNFFERATRVDYDLLKAVRGLVAGYEVEEVPMWQWEAAILDGYRVFRALRDHGGGRLHIDVTQRSLSYEPPLASRKALGE